MPATLIAHVDCEYADRAAIKALTDHCPPPTSSWRPLAHELVDNVVREKVERAGFQIIGSKYALSDPVKARKVEKERTAKLAGIYNGFGAKAMGILTVAHPNFDDVAMAIAWMSSYNKVWPLSLAAGVNVFVCDNLSFTGDVVTYRRHTSGIDLNAETDKALVGIRAESERMDRLIGGLKGAPCSDAQFEGIVCDGIRGGIFGGSAPCDLLNAWHSKATSNVRDGFKARLDVGVYDDRNGWSAHNLITDCAFKRKNETGNDFMAAHKALNGIVASRLSLNLN